MLSLFFSPFQEIIFDIKSIFCQGESEGQSTVATWFSLSCDELILFCDGVIVLRDNMTPY